MNNLKLALVAAVAAAVLVPAAAQSVSYNVALVSLYKLDGVDADSREAQSSRPALQGGVDYDFGNGFYVGNWNSTGKFAGQSSFEIDLYAGYANELASGLSYDLGVARYIYPDAQANANSNEAILSLGYGIATLKVTRGLSDSNKKASRRSITLTQPIDDKLTAMVVYGDRNKIAGNFDDFAVGADYDLGEGMTLSALVSGAGKVDGVKAPANKTRLVVGLAKSF